MPISPRFVVNFTVLLSSVGFLVLFSIIGMTVWLGERAQIYFDKSSAKRIFLRLLSTIGGLGRVLINPIQQAAP